MLLDSPPLARAPGSGAQIDAAATHVPRGARNAAPAGSSSGGATGSSRGYSRSLSPLTSRAPPRLPGVRDVLPAGSYAPRLHPTPQQIGASGAVG